MHWHYWRISVFWSCGWHVMGNLRCHIQPPDGNLYSLTKTASNALQGPVPSPVPWSLSNVITSTQNDTQMLSTDHIYWYEESALCNPTFLTLEAKGNQQSDWVMLQSQSEITPLLGQMLHPSLLQPLPSTAKPSPDTSSSSTGQGSFLSSRKASGKSLPGPVLEKLTGDT